MLALTVPFKASNLHPQSNKQNTQDRMRARLWLMFSSTKYHWVMSYKPHKFRDMIIKQKLTSSEWHISVPRLPVNEYEARQLFLKTQAFTCFQKSVVVTRNYPKGKKKLIYCTNYCHLEATIQEQSLPIKSSWLQRQDKKRHQLFSVSLFS